MSDNSFDSRFTFDSFVVARSNRFAAPPPSQRGKCRTGLLSPVLIWGHPGLGKTHLLHAIAGYLHLHHHDVRVRHLDSTAITADLAGALPGATDVLLIDDIHRLARRPDAQALTAGLLESDEECGRPCGVARFRHYSRT